MWCWHVNECTKAAILTFWNIMLEILDFASKPFVFCWISNFTKLKVFRLFILFVESLKLYIELGMNQAVFSNMLVRKNRNAMWWSSSFVEFPVFAEPANPEMPCGEVPVLLNFQFCRINKPRDAMHVMKSQFCCICSSLEMATSVMPLHVVRFQFCWFSDSQKEQLQTAVFLFCKFLQVC